MATTNNTTQATTQAAPKNTKLEKVMVLQAVGGYKNEGKDMPANLKLADGTLVSFGGELKTIINKLPKMPTGEKPLTLVVTATKNEKGVLVVDSLISFGIKQRLNYVKGIGIVALLRVLWNDKYDYPYVILDEYDKASGENKPRFVRLSSKRITEEIETLKYSKDVKNPYILMRVSEPETVGKSEKMTVWEYRREEL